MWSLDATRCLPRMAKRSITSPKFARVPSDTLLHHHNNNISNCIAAQGIGNNIKHNTAPISTIGLQKILRSDTPRTSFSITWCHFYHFFHAHHQISPLSVLFVQKGFYLFEENHKKMKKARFSNWPPQHRKN